MTIHRFDTRPDAVTEQLLAALREDLDGSTEDTWRFFSTLVSATPPYRTVVPLAYDLAVVQSSMASRFERAGLPRPAHYVTHIIGVRMAALLENPHVTATAACRIVGIAESTSNRNRWSRAAFGCSLSDFRETQTGASMIEMFRRELVLPFAEIWPRFHPLMASTRVGFGQWEAKSA